MGPGLLGVHLGQIPLKVAQETFPSHEGVRGGRKRSSQQVEGNPRQPAMGVAEIVGGLLGSTGTPYGQNFRGDPFGK